MATPNLDHPSLPLIKEQFPDRGILATEYREQTTVLVPKDRIHEVLRFLRDDPKCRYDFLSDVIGIDYLNYPANADAKSAKSGENHSVNGRFCVVYLLISTEFNRRLSVKTTLQPSLDTRGIEHDPALELESVTDIWPGAEWPEREVFDMFGIRFNNHPDLRRILTWESYPAHPLRKDYPLRGRKERETYRVITRDSA